jgi:protocatechuate 3,4-dioxygenase alpha subunit
VTSPPTPGQTVGPFFAFGLEYAGDSALVPPGSPGGIRLHGRVLDGAGEPVPDALVELWQADADGLVVQRSGSLRRDGYTFTGWGRASTDNTGHYTFTTIEPGAPFIALTVFARGLMNRLFTRIYLPDAADPFLLSVPAERRDTLIASREPEGLRFDVVLQGDGETVFLAYPGQS